MSKRKIFIIVIAALLTVVAITQGTITAVHNYKIIKRNAIEFDIADTLSDGGGKKATVILLGGQSNASGCSLDEYLQRNTTPEKYVEYEEGYDNVYINFYATGSNQSDGFVKCSVRQGEIIEDFGVCFGPELGLAEKLHEAYPDRTFFIIKCAWGNTALYDQWLSPWSKGPRGKHYRNFTTFVDASLKYLKSKNYDIEIAAMCWMQGECDAFAPENGIAYEENLQDFIGSIRHRYRKYAADGGIAFIDATIANNPMFWVHPEIVNESKRKVADSSHLNVLIDTNAAGLITANEPEEKPDVPHYDSMSEIKLGHLFAEAVLQFIE